MANFKTHLGVAAAGSGLLATACLGAGIAGPSEMIGLAIAGTVGGLLPDVDSDDSTPIKGMFTALGLIAAALAVFSASASASIVELWVVGCLAFCALRYAGAALFERFTVHRGVFHSLAAALLSCVLAATVAASWFGVRDRLAWATGFFLFFGYVVHLVLDEAFSVDLLNRRVKRSFGTALKLCDYRDWRTSAALAAALAAAAFVAPDPRPFLDVLADRATYERVSERFLNAKAEGSRRSALR